MYYVLCVVCAGCNRVSALDFVCIYLPGVVHMCMFACVCSTHTR